MITVRFDATGISKIRLSTSPLTEVAAWLLLSSSRRSHVLLGDTGPCARFALRDRDVVLAAKILASNRAGYKPDLLYPKPPPGGPDQVLDRQLQVLRETPPTAVVEQLTTYCGGLERMPRDVRRAVEAGRFTAHIANGLQRFWRTALVDQYDALKDLVVTDLNDRARVMAQGGVGQLLNTLHPRVSWTGDRLEIYIPYEATLDVAGADMVVAPAVLAFPYLQCVTDDPNNAVLIYPVAGLGTTPRPRTSTLVNLIGLSRACILRDLDTARSTTELSQRHQLTASTTSYHLGVLLASGMVHRARRGSIVEYTRSEHGDSLVRASPSGLPVSRSTPTR